MGYLDICKKGHQTSQVGSVLSTYDIRSEKPEEYRVWHRPNQSRSVARNLWVAEKSRTAQHWRGPCFRHSLRQMEPYLRWNRRRAGLPFGESPRRMDENSNPCFS